MPHIAFRRWIVACGALAALAACQSAPPPRAEPSDIRFTDRPPIVLNVARIEIVNQFRPDYNPPRIEQRLPIPLPHAVENWARDRLRAGGNSGVATVTIADASAIETAVPKKQDFSATFTDQVDRRYSGRVAVAISLNDGRGGSRMANSEAERSQTATEGMSVDERERALYRFETELLAEFDRRAEADIREHFAGYLR